MSRVSELPSWPDSVIVNNATSPTFSGSRTTNRTAGVCGVDRGGKRPEPRPQDL